LIAPPKAARYTTAEFLSASAGGAFAGFRVELVGGQLQRMGAPLNSHALYQVKLCVRLAAAVGEARVRGETGIELGADTVRVCDVALLRADVSDNRLLRPADLLLVIEIAESTIGRDLGPKRAAYAAAGIPHYWVVESDRRLAHLFEAPSGEEYTRMTAIRFGEDMPVPGSERTISLD
jgi:Uma2 family endonuclease